MTPRLARRGRLLVATGGIFVGAGALHASSWPLVALGIAIISAACTAYLAFFPAAVYLRRRKVEMAWWVPPGDQPGGGLVAERPFALHLTFRNHAFRPLRVLEVRVVASSAIEVPDGLAARLPAGYEAELVGCLRARACGHLALHGADVRFGDALGLFELRAYFPNPLALKVFPNLTRGVGDQVALRPQAGASHERAGVHAVRRRGAAGELREIRDHTHGDPFKLIAWKATARRRRLMVRELESEIVVTINIVVDIGPSMRSGPHGQSKLDLALALAAAIAKDTLHRGDRVGLATFDSRVHGELAPGQGRSHYLKLLDRLLETRNVVDTDLTDVTTGELVATLARYLLVQEGQDLRVRRTPRAHDPAWAVIATGPDGELYDMAQLRRIVQALLRRADRGPGRGQTLAHAPSPASLDPRLDDLRLFCRQRGIELPYRAAHVPGTRAAALADAMTRLGAHGRSHLVVVVSDFAELAKDPSAARALVHARRYRQSVVALAPWSPAPAPASGSLADRVVADTLSQHHRLGLELTRQRLGRLGVPLVTLSPGDGVGAIVRRLEHARTLRRGWA